MDIKKHTQPDQLERYAFLWSEARLPIAAVALFLGGVPPIIKIFAYSNLVSSLLNLAWIISGVASAYLLYMWSTKGMKLFGGTDHRDAGAFFVSVISGINLGLVGIIGTNIGMSITMNQVVFAIVGILYLVSALHLFMRWNESGKKLF
jgi:uncharacterized membrane protein YuzA (DUF378 family)